MFSERGVIKAKENVLKLVATGATIITGKRHTVETDYYCIEGADLDRYDNYPIEREVSPDKYFGRKKGLVGRTKTSLKIR